MIYNNKMQKKNTKTGKVNSLKRKKRKWLFENLKVCMGKQQVFHLYKHQTYFFLEFVFKSAFLLKIHC